MVYEAVNNVNNKMDKLSGEPQKNLKKLLFTRNSLIFNMKKSKCLKIKVNNIVYAQLIDFQFDKRSCKQRNKINKKSLYTFMNIINFYQLTFQIS